MASSSASGSEIKPAPSLLDIMKLPSQSGMQTLDKSAFNVTHPIISLRIDARKVPVIKTHPLIKPFLMDLPKTRPILTDDSDPSVRLLRLRVQSETDLPEVTREYIKQECLGTEPDRIELDYDHWTSSEILNSILPMGEGDDFAPSSFTQTGHIGHVNLREEWLPYKSLIGQVFLDKNPQLRTVVNKLDSIHAEYRYFDMEVIAGEDDLVTTAHEAGCYFTFDFSKVYWNSRLQHEHTRLVSLLQPGQVVADVMAGVGPFAVPAAKKGVFVLGNDLNPESVKWQQENRLKNKVEKTLRVTGLDGKAFIQQSARMAWEHPFPPYTPPSSRKKAEKEARSARQAQKASKDASASTASALDQLSLDKEALEPQLVQHFIMNLPDSALTFLDAFRGCLDPIKGEDGLEEKLSALGLPLVHVYCFTRELDPDAAQKDICERASQSLGYSVTPQIDSYNLHLVRRVAPNKDMYCLTFRLPRAVAFL